MRMPSLRCGAGRTLPTLPPFSGWQRFGFFNLTNPNNHRNK